MLYSLQVLSTVITMEHSHQLVVSPHVVDLIKQNIAQVKHTQDVPSWIAKSSEPYFLHRCLEIGVFQHIIDWKKFVKGLTALKTNPYIKHDNGEDPTKYLVVRDIVASAQPDEEKNKLQNATTKRYSFATWALWNNPSNRSKMYLPVQNIVAYCKFNNLDLEEFYKHVRKHHTAKGVMISVDLHDAEKQIENMLLKSVPMGVIPPTYPELDVYQNATIKKMLESPFAALQGGAGVGKTTTMAKLITSLVHASPPVIVHCLAFTHKAKRCIMEKLSANGLMDPSLIKVSTIHSFIATANAGSTIPACYILIDESSMIDVELLASLAQVIMDKCNKFQIGFSGDMMQLPPIGRGEFYRHLVSTKGEHVNELHKCYRTDRPDLFEAYQNIRNSEMPNTTNNFKVIYVDNDKEINSHIGKIIHSNTEGLLSNVQFIAWQNKDVFKINQWVQSALLKNKLIGPEYFHGLYKNDKVIYRGENTKTLTNALIGRVVELGSKSMIIEWEDGQRTPISHDGVKSINLAYALTVHCLQGSECSKAIVACYDVDKMKYCLDKRFLYTGVTRGKEEVIIVTTRNIQDFLNTQIRPPPLTGIQIPINLH